MTERILRLPEVLHAVKVGKTTLYAMEKARLFPARRLVGPRAIGWLESEVVEWMRTREASPGPRPWAAIEASLRARRAAKEAADQNTHAIPTTA